MRSVRFLKYGLLLASFISLLGIGSYLVLNDEEGENGMRTSQPLEQKMDLVHKAQKPTFQGVDEKNQPYHITAISSSTDDKTAITHLEHPTYSICLEGGDTLFIKADTGIFSQKEKNLVLQGNVMMTHLEKMKKDHSSPKKTVINMPFVQIKLDQGYATGEESITLQSDMLHAHAGAFEIYNKGDKIVLKNKPSLRFAVKTSHDH